MGSVNKGYLQKIDGRTDSNEKKEFMVHGGFTGSIAAWRMW